MRRSLISVRHGLRACTLLGVMLAAPAMAHAAPSTAECVAAAEEGQSLRDQGKLRQARDRFLVCANADCTKMVRPDCDAWLSDANERLPTVVFAARDSAGNDLTDVRITLDGQPTTEPVEGKAVVVDPGVHLVRFELAGRAPTEVRFVAREREKGRIVSAVLAPATVSTSPVETAPAKRERTPTHRPVPIASIVLGSAAIGLGGGFAYTWISAVDRATELRDT